MEVNPTDLARPLDWRLKTAQESAESGLYLSPADFDQTTRRAANYLSRRRRLTEPEHARLASSMPDVRWAIAVYENGGPIRAELEPRLLTDQPLISIGHELGATREAVACFAQLCFDVRGRLDQTGFIHQAIIAPLFAAGRHQEAFCKLVAYQVGQEALEFLLGRKRPKDISNLIDNLIRRAELIWKFRASQLAVEATTANSMSARQVFDAIAMIDRREAIAGSDSAIQDNLQAMLDELGPTFTAVGIANLPTEGPDSFAAELRTHELPFWALGLMTPEQLERLAELKFPEAIIEKAKQNADN